MGNRRRISRTTDQGTTYSTTLEGETTPEAMAALDQVADAAAKEMQAEQEARAYALTTAPGEHIRPRDLQAISKGALGFNTACRVLEALEKDGELVRCGPVSLCWMPAPPVTKPHRGYALPLSQKEHSALMRLLDDNLSPYGPGGSRVDDQPALRAIRAKLRGPA